MKESIRGADMGLEAGAAVHLHTCSGDQGEPCWGRMARADRPQRTASDKASDLVMGCALGHFWLVQQDKSSSAVDSEDPDGQRPLEAKSARCALSSHQQFNFGPKSATCKPSQ